MKKKVLTSLVASGFLAGVVLLTGCNNSRAPGVTENLGENGHNEDHNHVGMIEIQTDSGSRYVNPENGDTVVVRSNTDGTKNCVAVVHSELNRCTGATDDPDGDGIICGPESNVTYVFQSDFGKLGPIDNDPTTPDGGALLYDAQTFYNGTVYPTPHRGNLSENRIQTVYIPTNYLKVTDDFKTKSIDDQYNAMRDYLVNVCNMQCIATENTKSGQYDPNYNPNEPLPCDTQPCSETQNDGNSDANQYHGSYGPNPYFDENKTKGKFVATYVMWFPNGKSTKKLEEEFNNNNYKDLEYLTVQFRLDVEKADDNGTLRFTSPAGTKVVFGGKKKNESAVIVTADNDVINSILHERHTYVDSAFTINMAKYFDKVIAKGDYMGVSDYAKSILVKNAQHPWPVKIYGTLHEINDDGTFQRSFVRNPGKLNATTFNLDNASIPYSSAYGADLEDKTAVKAMEFCIVYPGGEYNDL